MDAIYSELLGGLSEECKSEALSKLDDPGNLSEKCKSEMMASLKPAEVTPETSNPIFLVIIIILVCTFGACKCSFTLLAVVAIFVL